MTLKERITEDMKAAMRASDKERLSTIRMVQAAIKQREVDERITLDDAQVIAVLEKMVKQRRESIVQFELGARQDLADKEKVEIVLLQSYLPAQLTEAEVEALIQQAIAETGAVSIKDMGKVMAVVKAKAAGRADMGAVERPHQGHARHLIRPAAGDFRVLPGLVGDMLVQEVPGTHPHSCCLPVQPGRSGPTGSAAMSISPGEWKRTRAGRTAPPPG